MARITLTAKRQATLPRALCEELHVSPGDQLELERHTIQGEVVWLVRAPGPNLSWIGSARAYGRRKSHRLEAVRESVARGRKKERRR